MVGLITGGVALAGITAPQAKACDYYSNFDQQNYFDDGCGTDDNGYYGDFQDDFNDYPDNSQFVPCGCGGTNHDLYGTDGTVPFYGQGLLYDTGYADP